MNNPDSTISAHSVHCEPSSPLKALLGPCLRSALFVALITGLAYPLATTGLAQLLFAHQANGSLILVHQDIAGFELIGQNFTAPHYFHPRPSATAPTPYNAGASSGSNLGPTSQVLVDTVQQRVTDYRHNNRLAADAVIPVDAVTASASGLDPHISVANTQLQMSRVAQSRGLSSETLSELVKQHTEGRTLGLLGEPRVNVLRLNLALDTLQASTPDTTSSH